MTNSTSGTSFDFKWRPQSDTIDDVALVTLGTDFSFRHTEKGAFPNAWIIFKLFCKCDNFKQMEVVDKSDGFDRVTPILRAIHKIRKPSSFLTLFQAIFMHYIHSIYGTRSACIVRQYSVCKVSDPFAITSLAVIDAMRQLSTDKRR